MTPIERLERLAAILEARPAEDPDFDLGIYAIINPCGVVACALGWGAADPVLNSEGLIYVDLGSGVPVEKAEGALGVGIRLSEPNHYVATNGRISNIRKFFGLEKSGPHRALPHVDSEEETPMDEFYWLFMDSAYSPGRRTGPHEVAARIRDLIKEKKL